ncbi:hypothetical protein Hypma_015295 [Hypsizygus marmoreus]|uniref:Uncharacterized protein n=1 Tax=Hypsizygus marmoreus TaxID=39966 RepID=A0A369K718_HYPMA|nr:hypothetical protein Hypma_015295 [Hypsizygus marmoreus]
MGAVRCLRGGRLQNGVQQSGGITSRDAFQSPKRHYVLELRHPPRFSGLKESKPLGGVFSRIMSAMQFKGWIPSMCDACGRRASKCIASKQGSRELKTPFISEMFGSLGMEGGMCNAILPPDEEASALSTSTIRSAATRKSQAPHVIPSKPLTPRTLAFIDHARSV